MIKYINKIHITASWSGPEDQQNISDVFLSSLWVMHENRRGDHINLVICRIDLSVAFDDLVGAVGQMRKLYKINEGMFNIDMF